MKELEFVLLRYTQKGNESIQWPFLGGLSLHLNHLIA